MYCLLEAFEIRSAIDVYVAVGGFALALGLADDAWTLFATMLISIDNAMVKDLIALDIMVVFR